MPHARSAWLRLLLLLCLCLLPSAHGLRVLAAPNAAARPGPVGPDWAAPARPGQLLVRLPGGAAAARGTLLGRHRVTDVLPQLGLALVEDPAGAAGTAGVSGGGGDPAAAAAALVARGLAEWAEPNYTLSPDAAYPNDPGYASQQRFYLDRLEMPSAWVTSTGRSEIIIAVVDTGVDISHPDLQAGIWTNAPEAADPGNGVDDDGNGYIDDIHGWNFVDESSQLTDGMGHGTHVAGIAAARINNGAGIAGMAGACRIMPVKVFPTSSPYIGTYYDLIRGIVYAADNGARVINLSLGASSYSRGEEAAVDYAWSRGALVVAAAGNFGNQAYHYPAAHAHALAVAATTGREPVGVYDPPADSRAGYSNWGTWVDLAAPGSSIYSTFPGGYTWMSGTSMATPHVAGLAALVLSVNPALGPDQVRQALWGAGEPLTHSSWDLGGGLGYRPRRINAGRTLAAVQPGGLPDPDPVPVLDPWPDGCVELLSDGDFEGGLGGWSPSGSAEVVTSVAYSGTHSLRFSGAPNSRGAVTRTVTLPDSPAQGALAFAYRIETTDGGWGDGGAFPYSDWLQAALLGTDGITITSLLRTGNSADTVRNGLAWDEYYFRMQPADFVAALRVGPLVELSFRAGNDGNSAPTDFYLDAVRWCVAGGTNPYLANTHFLPLVGR